MINLNMTVTEFLDELNHPLRAEIEKLRLLILESVTGLTENIKWNGPNYSFKDQDRITMRIQPPKQIQLIFHRGAKKQDQPEKKLIEVNTKLLTWKENDRAIMSFKNLLEIEDGKSELTEIIKKWIDATK
jgi:hypothetical protein